MAAQALQVVLFAFLTFFILCHASPLPAMESLRPLTPPKRASAKWVETFTAAPESVKLGAGTSFQDMTIRQTMPISIGADTIRITLSNAYGLSDLPIDKVTVALPQSEGGNLLGSGSIDTQSLRTVTFSGKDTVNVPRGGPAVSDPIALNLTAGQVISVSMYLRSGQANGVTTSHLYSQTTSATASGDQTGAARIPTTGRNGMSWYFISSVEALSASHKALVVIGDSITDGRGSPINANLKWPSILSRRAQANGLSDVSVVNQGSGGNQVVTAAQGPDLFQPSALSRLPKILAHDGLGYVMIFEGINDIGNAPPDAQGQSDIESRLIQGYKQIIAQVHARGLPAIGATITPFMCPPSHAGRSNRYALDPIRETTRLNVNKWIRSSNSFDAVVDFDQIIRDPNNPAQMAPQFIGPDCLHPSGAGYQALAEGFPLEILSTLGNKATA